MTPLSTSTSHRAPSWPSLSILPTYLWAVVSSVSAPSPSAHQSASSSHPHLAIYLPIQGNTGHPQVDGQSDHQLCRCETGIIVFLPRLVLPQKSGRHFKFLSLTHLSYHPAGPSIRLISSYSMLLPRILLSLPWTQQQFTGARYCSNHCAYMSSLNYLNNLIEIGEDWGIEKSFVHSHIANK